MSFFWTELNTTSPLTARAFYSATLGWTFEHVGVDPDYWIVKKDQSVIGGLCSMSGEEFEGAASHWFSYCEVENVDAACDVAVKLGGSILRAPTTIAKLGRIAIVRDPTGSPIGMIQPHRDSLSQAA
jgi:predicted enzyme related to lactoylglutathione lyase